MRYIYTGICTHTFTFLLTTAKSKKWLFLPPAIKPEPFMHRVSLLFILFFAVAKTVAAQNAAPHLLRASWKLETTTSKLEDTLRKQFEEKKLNWPPEQLFIRGFKYDRQLEIWVKEYKSDTYKLFKNYKVCMQSGTLGPKRMEGDYQMPEGFYYINEFNPNSNFHLSLGLNYPNTSDKILSDSLHPGSAIYIHGKCMSTGCIAIDNKPIEEVYLLAAYAKDAGQEFIPVHVFPVRFSNKKSFEYLAQLSKDNQPLQQFAISLKAAFDYFEANKKLPLITINKKGQYIGN
jgi:murein L,D-transpeptidase YafK